MTLAAARAQASPPDTETRNAFIASVIIHTSFLFVLLLGILIDSLRKDEPEHVFELVSLPTAAQVSPQNQQVSPAPIEPVDLPQLEPIVQSQPRPRVEIPVPQEAPVREESPPPEPAPQAMSAEEFQRRFGEPTQSQRVRPRQVDIPNIDMSQVEQALESIVVESSRTSVASMNQITQDALAAYISQLRVRIDQVWVKPSNYSGNNQEIVILFDVAPNGRITNVRVQRGNPGDPFSQSVMKAFARVGNAGPTPTGQSYTFRMPFRMVDPGG